MKIGKLYVNIDAFTRSVFRYTTEYYHESDALIWVWNFTSKDGKYKVFGCDVLGLGIKFRKELK